MFLEYWMIAVLLFIFVLGMLHLQRVGYYKGFQDGTQRGVSTTINMLERHGVLTEKTFEELTAKIIRERNR